MRFVVFISGPSAFGCGSMPRCFSRDDGLALDFFPGRVKFAQHIPSKMSTSNDPNIESHIIHQAIEWTGQSGTRYRYYIWPRGAKIEGAPPGNFLHVRVTEEGVLAPVFIAQTPDLNHRFLSQEEQDCVNRNGATQLHLHANYKAEQERIAEEADLVARWQPTCNLSRPPKT